MKSLENPCAMGVLPFTLLLACWIGTFSKRKGVTEATGIVKIDSSSSEDWRRFLSNTSVSALSRLYPEFSADVSFRKLAPFLGLSGTYLKCAV